MSAYQDGLLYYRYVVRTLKASSLDDGLKKMRLSSIRQSRVNFRYYCKNMPEAEVIPFLKMQTGSGRIVYFDVPELQPLDDFISAMQLKRKLWALLKTIQDN